MEITKDSISHNTKTKTVLIVTITAALGGGISSYQTFDEYQNYPNTTINAPIIEQFFQNDNLPSIIYSESILLNFKEKINKLRLTMGLTFADIGAILGVSRQTVYDWMNDKNEKIRLPNEKRLDEIFKLSHFWENKNVGIIGQYIYKPMIEGKPSLLEMLKAKELDTISIKKLMEEISHIISVRKEKIRQHEQLLEKHGFEKLSKIDMDRNLNDYTLSIGE